MQGTSVNNYYAITDTPKAITKILYCYIYLLISIHLLILLLPSTKTRNWKMALIFSESHIRTI